MNSLRTTPPILQQQRGAAFIVMLVILIMGVAAFLVSSLNSATVQIQRDKVTANALAKAKEALIGYAVTYSDTHNGQVPGYLPCPDSTGGLVEGSTAGNCGSKNVSQLGRLPWKTLGLPPVRDGNGDCLWYAVSGTYKYNPKTDRMNWDNNGLFTVSAANSRTLAGQTADTQAVAVIFSPGVPLNGQNRAPDGSAPICGGNYTAPNYLDSDVSISANNASPSTIANAISQFFAAGSTTNINDQIVFITKDDIFNAIKRRNDFQANLNNMTQAAATCLSSAGLPLPLSPNGIGAGWVPVNDPALTTCGLATTTWGNWWSNWADHLFYDPTGQDVNGHGYDAVIIFANSKLAGQTRPTAVATDYLEGNNSTTFTTGSPGYQTPPLSSTFNDVLFCVNSSNPATLCP